MTSKEALIKFLDKMCIIMTVLVYLLLGLCLLVFFVDINWVQSSLLWWSFIVAIVIASVIVVYKYLRGEPKEQKRDSTGW